MFCLSGDRDGRVRQNERGGVKRQLSVVFKVRKNPDVIFFFTLFENTRTLKVVFGECT